MKMFCWCCLVCLPLGRMQVTSPYGVRVHPVTGVLAMHDGVDLRAAADTAYAIFDGVIAHTGDNSMLGKHLELETGRLKATYGHLQTLLVAEGQTVFAGEPVAITGKTGRVTAPHLHFAIYYRGHSLDPLKFLYKTISKLKDHE